MKSFRVYRHPSLGMEAVKIGFSWPAFFFGFIWALIKRLWQVFFILIAIQIVAGVFSAAADESAAGALQTLTQLLLFAVIVALWVIPGIYGNRWRDANLAKRGYVLVDTVEAPNPDAAIAQVMGRKGD